VLDSHGNPRIAYAGRGGKLMLARRENGRWIREEVSSAGIIGRTPNHRVCLQIDSEDNPHIAYLDAETGHLFYGVKRGDQWNFTPVPTRLGFLEPGGVASYDFRLFFRRDTPRLRDTPHFIYHDNSTDQLGYTRKVDGRFKLVTAASSFGEVEEPDGPVGAVFDLGRFPSITFLQGSGAFLIAYAQEMSVHIDDPNPPLSRVWMKTILDPFEGTLSEETLLDEGRFSVIRPTSIAASSSGQFCVAYWDATNRKLKASVREMNIPDPVKHIVAEVDRAIVPMAASTSHGEFRIAYGDGSKLTLASQNKFGQWNSEVVDSEGGDMPFLAYDKLSRDGHVAYSVGSTLKYASWTETE
jgi:hypothetical protein